MLALRSLQALARVSSSARTIYSCNTNSASKLLSHTNSLPPSSQIPTRIGASSLSKIPVTQRLSLVTSHQTVLSFNTKWIAPKEQIREYGTPNKGLYKKKKRTKLKRLAVGPPPVASPLTKALHETLAWAFSVHFKRGVHQALGMKFDKLLRKHNFPEDAIGYVSQRPQKARIEIPEPEAPPPQVVPEGKLNDKELQQKVNEIVIRNLQ